jgi:hypothetical protein
MSFIVEFTRNDIHLLKVKYNDMTLNGGNMAINFPIFSFITRAKKVKEVIEDSDGHLKEITSSINEYLYQFGHSPFLLLIGRSHFQKCVKSWLMVSDHLEKFLQHPKENYSLFMMILEHEISRFPYHSFYNKQLRKVAQLIAKGPDFKEKILFRGFPRS